MEIIEISRNDFKSFWPVFKNVVEAQETYAFEPEIDFETAFELWCTSPIKSFVIKENNTILGSYYIKANAAGPSSHISNCGYMVAPEARGKGVARQLCLHSQEVALELGFQAMQFNSVVSTNKIAVRLWEKLGFKIIGTIPNAYRHKQYGFVDSFIMHKQLSTK